jgi:hypothetical protein
MQNHSWEWKPEGTMVRYGWLQLLLMLSCRVLATGQSSERSILSYKQYGAIEHQNPYVLEFKTGSGMLLFYGVEHTVDPKNSQVDDIEKRWAAFRPTVAYNEGGNPPTVEDVGESVQTYGEAGLVRFLAGRDQVPIATFEPPFDEEIAYLLKAYTPQQLKVFYALRQVTEERSRQASTSVDDRIISWLSRYLPAHGLKNAPNTLTELSIACKSQFPELTDWHQVPEEWFGPRKSGHYTNELAGDSGNFRNRYIFRLLVDRVKRGDRVFAVVGSSHVVVLEPALIKEFGLPLLRVNGLTPIAH